MLSTETREEYRRMTPSERLSLSFQATREAFLTSCMVPRKRLIENLN